MLMISALKDKIFQASVIDKHHQIFKVKSEEVAEF